MYVNMNLKMIIGEVLVFLYYIYNEYNDNQP